MEVVLKRKKKDTKAILRLTSFLCISVVVPSSGQACTRYRVQTTLGSIGITVPRQGAMTLNPTVWGSGLDPTRMHICLIIHIPVCHRPSLFANMLEVEYILFFYYE